MSLPRSGRQTASCCSAPRTGTVEKVLCSAIADLEKLLLKEAGGERDLVDQEGLYYKGLHKGLAGRPQRGRLATLLALG